MNNNEFEYNLYFNEDGETIEDIVEELIVENIELKQE